MLSPSMGSPHNDPEHKDNREAPEEAYSSPPTSLTQGEEAYDSALETIKRQIRSDALQHPVTLFPIGMSAISLIYLFLFAPYLGGGLIALIASGGFGALGFGSLGWHWRIRGQKYLEEKAREFVKLQAQNREENESKELALLELIITEGFAETRFAEGKKALRELQHEFFELQGLLTRLPEESNLGGSTLLSNERIHAVGRQTYLQGLMILQDAAERKRTIFRTDASGLEDEAAQLRKDIAELRDHPSGTESSIIVRKEGVLKSHEERIAIIRQQELGIQELLDESDRCEGALQTVRLELPALRTQGSRSEIEELLIKLEVAIKYSKEVQERLREHGLD